METLSSSAKNVKLAAGLLGIIQSLAWIVLSVICIAMHLAAPLDLTSTTYMGKVQFCIYEFFLKDYHNITFTDQILTPDVFHAFEWIYFVEDVVWLLASLNVLINTKISFSLKFWSFATMIVCIFDLITTIILGVDYSDCSDDALNSETESFCSNGILPVLMIAAKGFVLWIVDLVFAILLFRISRQLQPQRQIYSSNDTIPALPALPRAHHHSPYLAHDGYGQQPISPVAPAQYSPNAAGYSRHWSGFSTGSDSPKSPTRSNGYPSPIPSATSNQYKYGMARENSQKPFVLSPPPKRRR